VSVQSIIGATETFLFNFNLFPCTSNSYFNRFPTYSWEFTRLLAVYLSHDKYMSMPVGRNAYIASLQPRLCHRGSASAPCRAPIPGLTGGRMQLLKRQSKGSSTLYEL
jgi:hypothetical protein